MTAETSTIDYSRHLPPYRSLLNPTARYDYRTHSLVPMSEQDLRNIALQNVKSAASDKIKMRYKSLLDAGKKKSILSLRLAAHKNSSVTIKSLPVEILQKIMYLVDDVESYLNCLRTCKLFYQVTKSILYEKVSFTSAYRFAQFITYLRISPETGFYVRSVDLSHIKPGVQDDDFTLSESVSIGDEENDCFTINEMRILAGWRDWKFLKNPLFSMHSVNLTKIVSTSQHLAKSYKSQRSSRSSNSNKFLRLPKTLNYFKGKKRQRFYRHVNTRSTAISASDANKNPDRQDSSTHPLLNKFLMNYSSSKDLPVGYILHLISLCPNMTALNLGNLSLSTDYEIKRLVVYKFSTYDLMNNYPHDLAYRINDIMDTYVEGSSNSTRDKESLYSSSLLNNEESSKSFQPQSQLQQPASSTSSIYSLVFSKPQTRYNSLLPPLPSAICDMSYVSKGDGRFFLSDLSLKSINESYLTRINEAEILNSILKGRNLNDGAAVNLNYINLSSMVWLTKRMASTFLRDFIKSDLAEVQSNSDSNIESDVDETIACRDMVIDLSDSGMHKDLEWAKLIDLNLIEGCRLAKNIMNDQVWSAAEESLRRDRSRRGRIGENYLS